MEPKEKRTAQRQNAKKSKTKRKEMLPQTGAVNSNAEKGTPPDGFYPPHNPQNTY